MSAHTPGPWSVEALPSDPYIVYGGGTHGNGERRYICVTANGFFGCDESIANARLIAAAPALLEALELTLDGLGALCNPHELTGYGMTREQIDSVFSAIAAASGNDER